MWFIVPNPLLSECQCPLWMLGQRFICWVNYQGLLWVILAQWERSKRHHPHVSFFIFFHINPTCGLFPPYFILWVIFSPGREKHCFCYFCLWGTVLNFILFLNFDPSSSSPTPLIPLGSWAMPSSSLKVELGQRSLLLRMCEGGASPTRLQLSSVPFGHLIETWC